MPIFQKYTTLINNALIKIVSFFTIIILGLVIGRFLGKLTYKLLNELDLDNILTKRLNTTVDVEKMAGKFVQYLIYTISFFYALYYVGLPLKVFYYIMVLLLFVLVVFIILQTKDYIENMIIGVFFIDKKFLKIGQKIKIRAIEGFITKISSTEIKIITENNDTFFIPNTVLKKSSLFTKEKN